MPGNKRPLTPSISPRAKKIKLHKRSSSAPPGEHQKTLEDYIKKLDGYSKFNKRFARHEYASVFQIVDLPADPERMFLGIFEFCMNVAREEAKQNGINPDQMSINIDSKLLNDSIHLGFREYTENTSDAFYNRFLSVVQSYKQNGISLFGEPFEIKI